MEDVDFEVLPELYGRWARALFGDGIPRERKASCSQCAMCAPKDAPPTRDTNYFHPSTKCCTYLPRLPNFLVGRVLRDETPAAHHGRTTVQARVAEKVGVNPLGLDRPPIYSSLYAHADNYFGRAPSMRCRHYLADTGGCGIWNHRNGICSTWFCKHVRGAVGRSFWIVFQELIEVCERELSIWCMLQLDPGDKAVRALTNNKAWTGESPTHTAESMEGQVDPEAYRQLWGRWAGREAEFYVRCAELVEPLSWDEVVGLCGQDAQAYARLARRAYAELLDEATPPRLTPGAIDIKAMTRESIRVNSYRAFDPVELPHALFAALAYFDGGDNAAALAAIEKELGVRLEPELLRKLVDFRLLTVAEAGEPAAPAG